MILVIILLSASGFNPSKEMTAVPPSAQLPLPLPPPLRFNPSKEMTAVPPKWHRQTQSAVRVGFQPLKGNDSRAAEVVAYAVFELLWFQPLKGNDSRAA